MQLPQFRVYQNKERYSLPPFRRKFSWFCLAWILFCLFMYIPVYNRTINDSTHKGILLAWPIHKNRDTKIYIKPNNVTTIHDPKNMCNNKRTKKLPLLIIVCSSIENFERRKAIRETWGRYQNYIEGLRILKEVRKRYKNYKYEYDLYPLESDKEEVIRENATTNFNYNDVTTNRSKLDLSSSNQLLPVLAKPLTTITLTNARIKEKVTKELLKDNMKKDFADEENAPDLNKDIGLDFDEIKETVAEPDKIDRDFNLVFLLGLPVEEKKGLQQRIENEIKDYRDVIQEGFVDSYYNLTLKSIMMLKWVTNRCSSSVRYILKADDDIYINIPYLMMNLNERSKKFDKNLRIRGIPKNKEYLLIGDRFKRGKPYHYPHSKWFVPPYMYNGSKYPRYLSGTGYVMSMPAAHALYEAALTTDFFHFEDIYITGMCASRATPRLLPEEDVSFSMHRLRGAGPHCLNATGAHHLGLSDMRRILNSLLQFKHVDRCERMRLTQIRQNQRRSTTNTATQK